MYGETGSDNGNDAARDFHKLVLPCYDSECMRIEEDIKLDYKDVLIRPKRSTLSSRKEVDISRTINFEASGQSITGVPIIAANMDGVGTFAMARVFIKQKMFVALHKHYTVPE